MLLLRLRRYLLRCPPLRLRRDLLWCALLLLRLLRLRCDLLWRARLLWRLNLLRLRCCTLATFLASRSARLFLALRRCSVALATRISTSLTTAIVPPLLRTLLWLLLARLPLFTLAAILIFLFIL